MTAKVILKEINTTKTYMFAYYNKQLSRLYKNFNAANIIAELKTTDEYNQITIYESTPHKTKTKICDIFSDEIDKILLNKSLYIQPNTINTLIALKKAIVINVLG